VSWLAASRILPASHVEVKGKQKKKKRAYDNFINLFAQTYTNTRSFFFLVIDQLNAQILLL